MINHFWYLCLSFFFLYFIFYCVSDNNKMYKFWMYYLGTPNNVGQDPPLSIRDNNQTLEPKKLSKISSSLCTQVFINDHSSSTCYKTIWLDLKMSKWVPTSEPTWLTTGSSRIGLRKNHYFQKWVELNLAHLTHGLNGFEPFWRWVDPSTFFYNFFNFLL